MVVSTERRFFKGDKLGVRLSIEYSSPRSDSLQLNVDCHFVGQYNPMFLRLSRDVVSKDLVIAVQDAVMDYVDTFLSSDQEVSGDE